MKIKSPRCGKGCCEFYDKNNHESKCNKFTNRNLCPISNKQRRKAANHSRKEEKYWF